MFDPFQETRVQRLRGIERVWIGQEHDVEHLVIENLDHVPLRHTRPEADGEPLRRLMRLAERLPGEDARHDSDIPGFPYVEEQSFGAYIGLAVFALWMARDDAHIAAWRAEGLSGLTWTCSLAFGRQRLTRYLSWPPL